MLVLIFVISISLNLILVVRVHFPTSGAILGAALAAVVQRCHGSIGLSSCDGIVVMVPFPVAAGAILMILSERQKKSQPES